MKKILFVIAVALSLTACGTRVQPNHVGVLMENYGKEGKSDFSLQKGRVSTIAPGTELYQVPLWEQRARFESPIELKAADNTAFTSIPVYSFKIIEKRAIDVVFDNKQIGSGEAFMQALQDNILEPKIFDIMNEESRKYNTETLMESGGSLKFEEKVQALVKQEFDKRGLELLNFSCKLAFSKKVTDKIDSRNEVNTNIAVLDQKIEEQKKSNQLELLIAEQNRIRSSGLSPILIQQQFIEKWDGKAPLYGNTPLTRVIN